MRFLAILLAMLVVTEACTTAAPRRGRGAGPGGARPAMGRGGRGMNMPAARVERRSYVFPPTGERLDYAVFIGSRVQRDQPSPLVIVLHGLGTSPSAFLPRVAGPVSSSGYILVAPMGYRTNGWYGANGANGIGTGRQTGSPSNLGELSERDVMHVLELAKQEFKVDTNRIYIMGNSMGGAGAIFLGLKHRNIWAAVGARAPAIRTWHHTPAELEKAGDLPMVFVHGDADRSVPVTISRDWAAKMKELGIVHEYHELPGVGHGVDPEGVRRIFAFFDKHR